MRDKYFRIEFTFTGSAITTLAPRERVLIVCDQAAFEARYGTVHNNRIAGEFAPTRLDNAGERLLLLDGLGEVIADLTYNDKIPWPSQAGFAGYSMVLKPGALPGPDYNFPGSGALMTNLLDIPGTPALDVRNQLDELSRLVPFLARSGHWN